MTRRATTTGLILRHVAHGRAAGALVAVLVLVVAALVTAAPLAASALQAATLRDELARLSPVEADVTASNVGMPASEPVAQGRVAPVAEVWGPFESSVDGIRASAPAPLPQILGPARVVTRAQDNVLLPASDARLLTVAFDPGYRERVSLVEGAWPAAPDIAVTSRGAITGGDVIEIVLSEASAAELEWAIGEARATPGRALGASVRWLLTGTFAATDPDDAYWQHERSILEPNVFDDGNRARTVTGTGYVDPAALVVAWTLPARVETSTWFPVDRARIATEDAEAVAAALRGFAATAHPLDAPEGGTGLTALRFRADIVDTIDAAIGQARASIAILAMLASGPLGVAGLVVLLACRLILERRRPALRVLSARGASRGQLRVILGGEGMLLGVVPAAIGVAGVLAFTRTPPSPALLGAPVLVALVPAIILTVLAAGAADRAERTDLGRRAGRTRAVLEGSALVLAAVAVVLLFTRGYTLTGVDPLLAATPLLVALAGAVLTMRAYPAPLRAILERARRGARLPAFLGAARALREPALGLVPVLALLVGVAVAVSSGILLSTLQAGIREAAAGQVGADIRVTAGTFPRGTLADVQATAGVAAATGVSGAQPAQLSVEGTTRAISVHVVDAAELAVVQGSGPGILPPGADLEEAADDGIPIVVSPALATLADQDAEVTDEPVRVVGIVHGQTPLSSRVTWVAVDAAHARALLGADPVDRVLLVRVEDGADIARVQHELRGVLGTSVRIDTAADLVDRIESGPAVVGLRVALAVATGLGAALSALAVVLTLALAAPQRERLAALVRALGAPRRAAGDLAAWEIAPPAVAATIGGSVLGAVLPLLVLAAVDLRPFTGAAAPPPYRVDPVILVLSVGGFLALTAAITAVAALSARRAKAAAALRTVAEA